MYSGLKLQKEPAVGKQFFVISDHLVTKIKSRFQEFRTQIPDPEKDEYTLRDSRWSSEYNVTRSKFCKKIYLETKNFFDVYQDDLSPVDKMVVLQEYFILWKDVGGYLDIADTDFSEQYQGKNFGKYATPYKSTLPMLAGFNLKNISCVGFYEIGLMFLAVNFSGADFKDAKLAYSSFNDCIFIDSDVSEANFNQSRFQKCLFERVDLSETKMAEVRFERCIMYQTKYNKKVGMSVYKCFDDRYLTALTKKDHEPTYSQNIAGNTPLHMAVIKGQIERIEFLLKQGADVNAVNVYGHKPFCMVPRHYKHYSLKTFEKMVMLLTEAGLNLNQPQPFSKSYLAILASCGALEACQFLVAHGADINIQDTFGDTPLHGAISKKRCHVITWLLSMGADKNIENNMGETAQSLAKKIGRRDIINLLNYSRYPFFLQHLKVKPKQLTAEKVANALWLLDKDAKTTAISISEFGLWAKKQDLCFNQNDIEACLSSYVMKK